jgi:hypothetical protein
MELKKAHYKTALSTCNDWKDIAGYEGLYQIHWRGYVRNTLTKFLLRAGLAGNGYLTVSLVKNKQHKTFTIHSLVAKHFIPNPFNHKCVNHINGKKTDNRLLNLEWVSYKENNAHALVTGLRKVRAAKGVIQLDLNGNEIARYHSSEHVPSEFSGGNVCHVCNGKRKQHGGYKWKWINE